MGRQTGDLKYKALENCTWSGNGRVVFENGGLSVKSRISQVVPSTENPLCKPERKAQGG